LHLFRPVFAQVNHSECSTLNSCVAPMNQAAAMVLILSSKKERPFGREPARPLQSRIFF
jgi:hypothetical protein